ncbi:MAG TPA: cyclic nucleotide-binding domain-containing protein [Gammaproteobacteria bacterium]|nr:cyclic nucleotide-binding domain-containing protein [Gammaproteobacteria bacterium]
MSKTDASELIQRSTLTSDLSPEQCTELAGLSVVRELDDGELLIEQGKIDETLHIIGEGALAVERKTGGAEKVTLFVLKCGDLAGELGFIDGTEHSASLRAIGKTTVVSLRRQDLESVLESSPRLVYGVMRGIVRTVHRILREMNMQYVELNNYITKTHGRY